MSPLTIVLNLPSQPFLKRTLITPESAGFLYLERPQERWASLDTPARSDHQPQRRLIANYEILWWAAVRWVHSIIVSSLMRLAAAQMMELYLRLDSIANVTCTRSVRRCAEVGRVETDPRCRFVVVIEFKRLFAERAVKSLANGLQNGAITLSEVCKTVKDA